MSLNIEAMEQWLRLDDKRKALESEAKACKDDAAKLAAPIMDNMTSEGVKNVKVPAEGGGYRTISIRSQIWPKQVKLPGESPKDYKKRLYEVLDERGVGDDMAPRSVNAQSMAAYVREFLAEGGELPEDLQTVYEPAEKLALVQTKS